MSFNIKINSLVNYKPCVKCNKRLSRIDGPFCKDCKPKRESDRTLNKSLSKVYLNKFEANNSSYGKEDAKGYNLSESKLVCTKFKLSKELSIEKNTGSNDFFTLYWDKFNDFESFSSFITNSSQVSSMYFLFNSSIIQQKPKYQQFIISNRDKLPTDISTIQVIIPIPISRPLQLLTQKSYWDGLITSYFKYIHHTAPIFSIHSFNSNTTGKSLLSAIYYGGFLFMQDKPPELVKYFNEYAEHNIKEAIRCISFQNAQAVFLYSFLMIISGNVKLFKACQAHSIRMCYALGLHLNLKKLTPIQQYDRFQLFSTACAYHIGFSGINNLSLNQLTELGDCNIEILKPEYQIPNSKCAFYFDTEDENIVYGICTHSYFVLTYVQLQNIYNLGKCSNHSIQTEFNTFMNNLNQKYLECISTNEFLLKEFPHHKPEIQSSKSKLIIIYHVINLELYRILRYKVKQLTRKQISKMLEECVMLLDSIIESQGITQITYTYPYTAGLNFISIYPIANSLEKSLIKQKLCELLYYFSKGPVIDKLSYLIIKKEYENINKS